MAVIKMNSKEFGTAILVDLENIKIPNIRNKKNQVKLLDIVDKIKEFIPDVHYNTFVFAKSFFRGDKRSKNLYGFFKKLKKNGITVIKKNAATKTYNVITDSGEAAKYKFEKCDMDGLIVHYIHTLGKKYDKIVYVGGDGDMYEALKYIQDEYNTEVTVCSYKKNISSRHLKFNFLIIDEIVKNERDNRND